MSLWLRLITANYIYVCIVGLLLLFFSAVTYIWPQSIMFLTLCVLGVQSSASPTVFQTAIFLQIEIMSLLCRGENGFRSGSRGLNRKWEDCAGLGKQSVESFIVRWWEKGLSPCHSHHACVQQEVKTPGVWLSLMKLSLLTVGAADQAHVLGTRERACCSVLYNAS